MTAADHFDGTSHSKQSLRVWLRLAACNRIIEARIRRSFEVNFSTTLPRFDVLATLDHALSTTGKGLTMGELSKRLLVSNGNVTGIVNRLAGENYIRKTKQRADGRSHLVEFTPKGKKYFAELANAHEKWIDEILFEMSDEEMGSILPTLGKMKAILGNNNAQNSPVGERQ